MKIIIRDKNGNDLCSFNVYNSHQYYDDDVEIEKGSLKDCDILIPDVAIHEFHQLRNDDEKFANLYGKDDVKEWYEEHSDVSLKYNGYCKSIDEEGKEYVVIKLK